ncbi:hypothetical protein DBZ36_16160 [Alginatibacterium sediminis]|uniref:Uncharacterized protein n=1 Tax=Alginatibacterium sediminis TaxID=2164068 RepID=A0A420E8Y1_9ALTE|nr:hypothetical protein DBZ36_16160 [Alginatibacterium sediminis]
MSDITALLLSDKLINVNSYCPSKPAFRAAVSGVVGGRFALSMKVFGCDNVEQATTILGHNLQDKYFDAAKGGG